jgi:hypothetical protein
VTTCVASTAKIAAQTIASAERKKMTQSVWAVVSVARAAPVAVWTASMAVPVPHAEVERRAAGMTAAKAHIAAEQTVVETTAVMAHIAASACTAANQCAVAFAAWQWKASAGAFAHREALTASC